MKPKIIANGIIRYALKNGHTVHISEVVNGLACNCICSCCEGKLVAHKGLKNIEHFQHYSMEECTGAYETSIHLAAKRLFEHHHRVVIPPYWVSISKYGRREAVKQNEYVAQRVITEKKVNDFKPDVHLKVKQVDGEKIESLIVEIAVTHFIDKEKKQKIIKNGISTIEINLSKLSREADDIEIWEHLTNPENITWIFNRRHKEFLKLEKEKIVKEQKDREEEYRQYELKQKQALNEQRKLKEEMKLKGLKFLPIYSYRNELDESVFCPKQYATSGRVEYEKCIICNYNHGRFKDLDSYGQFIVCGFKIKLEKVKPEPISYKEDDDEFAGWTVL